MSSELILKAERALASALDRILVSRLCFCQLSTASSGVSNKEIAMDIDTATLATTIVTYFLLPYLKLGGTTIAKKITEKVGGAAADEAVNVTQKIWDRVKSAFSSERDQHVLSEFEDDPDAARPLIEAKLKKKLEQDPSLAEDLHQLVNASGSAGVSTGAQIMKAHIAGILDVRGADFSNSHNIKLAGVMIGEDQASIHTGSPEGETEGK